ncbi:MAG TPA: DUF1684 domain-containing protein [Bryobacteraceae bacterium]|nr:DUF1684 domain-containing protein [Bryobacteraceae bacterium]
MSASLLANDPSTYRTEIESWRAKRAESLKAPDGWLSLVGLAWLEQGENTVGSAENNRVVLPKRLPAKAATIHFDKGVARITSLPGVALKVNGKPVTTAELRSDTGGKDPDIAEIDGVIFYVIHRDPKYGIRIKDPQSPARTGFLGLDWYPVKPDWRIDAKWIKSPTTIEYDAITGGKQREESPGYAEFQHNGQTIKLQATIDTGDLFFVFRDATAGKTTYPAARFLKAKVPTGDHVTLDFNKAYNPPCVFTAYATCPLPLPQNRLSFPIEAGERKYKGSSH